MEHIHGRLLADDQDKVLIEEIDGYLGCRPTRTGSKLYFGYFELPSDQTKRIDQSAPYRLVLDDGRIGLIYTDMQPSKSPGMMLAEFHVSGEFRNEQ